LAKQIVIAGKPLKFPKFYMHCH